jgi:hypothetical protein
VPADSETVDPGFVAGFSPGRLAEDEGFSAAAEGCFSSDGLTGAALTDDPVSDSEAGGTTDAGPAGNAGVEVALAGGGEGAAVAAAAAAAARAGGLGLTATTGCLGATLALDVAGEARLLAVESPASDAPPDFRNEPETAPAVATAGATETAGGSWRTPEELRRTGSLAPAALVPLLLAPGAGAAGVAGLSVVDESFADVEAKGTALAVELVDAAAAARAAPTPVNAGRASDWSIMLAVIFPGGSDWCRMNELPRLSFPAVDASLVLGVLGAAPPADTPLLCEFKAESCSWTAPISGLTVSSGIDELEEDSGGCTAAKSARTAATSFSAAVWLPRLDRAICSGFSTVSESTGRAKTPSTHASFCRMSSACRNSAGNTGTADTVGFLAVGAPSSLSNGFGPGDALDDATVLPPLARLAAGLGAGLGAGWDAGLEGFSFGLAAAGLGAGFLAVSGEWLWATDPTDEEVDLAGGFRACARI